MCPADHEQCDGSSVHAQREHHGIDFELAHESCLSQRAKPPLLHCALPHAEQLFALRLCIAVMGFVGPGESCHQELLF